MPMQSPNIQFHTDWRLPEPQKGQDIPYQVGAVTRWCLSLCRHRVYDLGGLARTSLAELRLLV